MKNSIFSELNKRLKKYKDLHTFYQSAVVELKKGTFDSLYHTQTDKSYKRYEFRMRLNLYARSIKDLKLQIKQLQREQDKSK